GPALPAVHRPVDRGEPALAQAHGSLLAPPAAHTGQSTSGAGVSTPNARSMRRSSPRGRPTTLQRQPSNAATGANAGSWMAYPPALSNGPPEAMNASTSVSE